MERAPEIKWQSSSLNLGYCSAERCFLLQADPGRAVPLPAQGNRDHSYSSFSRSRHGARRARGAMWHSPFGSPPAQGRPEESLSPLHGAGKGEASITGGCAGGPCSTLLCTRAAATLVSAPPSIGYAATGALAQQRLTYGSSLRGYSSG